MLSLAVALAVAGTSPDLQKLFDREWERWMREAPTWASNLGDRRYNDKWPDLSLAAMAKSADDDRAALQDLAALKVADVDALDAAVFKDILETRVGLYENKLWLTPLDQQGGVHAQDQLIDSLRFSVVKDYDDWIARMRAYPAYVDQHIAILELAAKDKIAPPRVVMERALPQVRAQVVSDPSKSSFYRPFAKFPASISAKDAKRLEASARDVIAKSVVPALKKLADVVEKTVLPVAPTDVGIGARPGGDKAYAFLVKMHTTTNMTPDQIHALGLAEVKRIRGEMERVKTTVGFKGTLAEFFTFLRTDPRFYYTSGDEILAGTRALAKKIDGRLHRVLKTMPRTPYGVEPIPDAIAPDVTTAYYSGPAPDGSRAGTYYVNLYKPQMRPKWEMVPLCVHEAVPGHHTQVALASELTSLPIFRREAASYTAFVEGWGLYAESLGAEMDLYGDPYDRMGQLAYEMWRAVRLVVDTGMHAKGWTRDQAIKFFADNAPKTELDIRNEVDRYIVWPGQALAYKIGQLKIRELRTRAEKKLGARFNLGEFHDVVLLQGPLPLGVLEKRVDAWIAR